MYAWIIQTDLMLKVTFYNKKTWPTVYRQKNCCATSCSTEADNYFHNSNKEP